jgi:hypothetical protein
LAQKLGLTLQDRWRLLPACRRWLAGARALACLRAVGCDAGIGAGASAGDPAFLRGCCALSSVRLCPLLCVRCCCAPVLAQLCDMLLLLARLRRRCCSALFCSHCCCALMCARGCCAGSSLRGCHALMISLIALLLRARALALMLALVLVLVSVRHQTYSMPTCIRRCSSFLGP